MIVITIARECTLYAAVSRIAKEHAMRHDQPIKTICTDVVENIPHYIQSELIRKGSIFALYTDDPFLWIS